MKTRLFVPLAFLLIAAQVSPPVAITSPAPNEVLRGQVAVTGRVDIVNFSSARLEFAYAVDPTDSWFTIQTFSPPLVDSTLALWDTTTITDGAYLLRLRVTLEDGSLQEAAVPVQIGNDLWPTPSPAPTATLTPESALLPTPFFLAASPTATETARPTPTALPPNPLSLEQRQIYGSLGRGALVIIGLFALAGLVLRVRRD